MKPSMGLPLSSRRIERLYSAVLILGVFALGVALFEYAYSGIYMRYSGDDYCYGSVLTQYGFWKAQSHAYLNPVPFHGNRYSLTFLALSASLFDPLVNGLLPGLAILLWLVGMAFLILRVNSRSSLKISTVEAWLIAEFFVFVTLYTAPDLPESLYWRSGMLPYLAPIIANLFLIVAILRAMSQPSRSYSSLGFIFVLSILAGGFSETVAAFQVAYLIAWQFLIWIEWRSGTGREQSAVMPASVAFAGSVFAVILLLASPSTRNEIPEGVFLADMLEFVGTAIRHANSFILGSLRGLPLPHFVIFVFFMVVSFMTSHRRSAFDSIGGMRLSIKLFLLISVCYFLISMSMAPWAVVRNASPNPRALLAARFVLALVVAVGSFLIGDYIFRSRIQFPQAPKYLVFVALFLLIGVFVYAIRGATRDFSVMPRYQYWASRWDERDESIRIAKGQGILDIEVDQLQGIIQWVGELSSDPSGWYNACAAQFYGVRSIAATLP